MLLTPTSMKSGFTTKLFQWRGALSENIRVNIDNYFIVPTKQLKNVKKKAWISLKISNLDRRQKIPRET